MGPKRPHLWDLPGYNIDEFLSSVLPTVEHVKGLLQHGEDLRELPTEIGSPLALERAQQAGYAGEWGSTPVDDAVTIIHLLLIAGEGHAWSLLRVLGDKRSGPATVGVLVRAALESWARAVWLAEPALGAVERIRRSKNEVVYSIREQHAIGINKQDNDKRVTVILDTAELVGIGTLPPTKKPRLPRRLSDRPSATNLVSQLMLDGAPNDLGQFTYKLLSATSHGTFYGLARFVNKSDLGADGMPLGIVGISSSEVLLMLRLLCLAYTNTIERVAVLHGWQSDAWSRSVANANRYFLDAGV